jgi:lipoyl-dependent peroxiredoxin
MKILYTTEATVEGGRAGRGRTADGRLAVELSTPKELGGQGGPGTNPEQLFAIGYAACFQSSLLAVARGLKVDVADSAVTAHVGIGPTGSGGFGLAVALDLDAPTLSRVQAEDLMRRARPDQVDTRNAEPTGDGSGPSGEWSRRDRTTRQRGALFLTWCEQVAYADHGSLGQSRPYNLSGTST